MNRARNGFGAHGLFFRVLKPHFDLPSNARRLATSLLGCAAEQWINAELFQALVGCGREFFVWPENRKHDLVVYRDAAKKDPELIVETKLLYARYGPGKKATKLHDLARQLLSARQRYPDAQALGLVVTFEWVDATQGAKLPRAAQNCFMSEELRNLLPNAFGQPSRYRVQGCGQVEIGPRRFAVRTAFEMVRLAPDHSA
jgi:hypothetical protein